MIAESHEKTLNGTGRGCMAVWPRSRAVKMDDSFRWEVVSVPCGGPASGTTRFPFFSAVSASVNALAPSVKKRGRATVISAAHAARCSVTRSTFFTWVPMLIARPLARTSTRARTVPRPRRCCGLRYSMTALQMLWLQMRLMQRSKTAYWRMRQPCVRKQRTTFGPQKP